MQPRWRREDRRLLTGAGQYVADHNRDGQAHAAFRRSDRAHARIVSVDVSAARQSPGVIAVLTASDLEGTGLHSSPPMMPFPGRGGSRLLVPERPLLAGDRVRHVGEPIAVVIAESAGAAADAAELIEIIFDDLPAVIGFDAALSPGAPVLHDAVPGNICFDFDYGDEPATAAAMAQAAHVVQISVDSPRVAPTPLELRAFLTWYDAAEARFEVRCANQGTPALRDELAGMIGVTPDRVRVPMVDVGGAFGARMAAFSEYPVLMHAARSIGRPIKWMSTRAEDFLTDTHGRAIRLEGALGLDAGGGFVALRTRWLCDTGAYLATAGAMTNSANGMSMGAGPYRIPAVYGRHFQVMTNTSPTSAYRGAGRPEAALIVERLVDAAAAQLGIDPLELRRRNVIPPEAMPYRTPTGAVFDSGDFAALLDEAERLSDWGGFAERSAAAAASGKLRGIGCALFLEPAGGGGAAKDQVAIRFEPDGQVSLFMVAGASGQGHETVFPHLVADWLGLDPARVVLRAGDPDGPSLTGGAAVGSRTAMTQGSAFRVAADEVIHKALALAADSLEAAVGDLEFRDGDCIVAGTDRRIPLLQIIEQHAGGPTHPLDSTGEVPPPRNFPSGAHIAEVEIDPETGASCIAVYTAVDDLGAVLNRTLVHGQMVGAVVQGAGQVFGEQVLYDPGSGQMLNASFMDYTMPRADLVHEFRLADRNVPSPANLLGAKGAGEAGVIGAGPACMNALADALRRAGATMSDMPATPARLWSALHGHPLPEIGA